MESRINPTKEDIKNYKPLRNLVFGRAGTGKSAVISALRSLLQDRCSLSAFTGIAAGNIDGKTIHS